MNIKDHNIYIALVHYPIKNKDGEIITTAVTNIDVHDLARLCATFGFKSYYIVTPITEQKALVERIVSHWKGDYGQSRNNKRSTALGFIEVSSNIEGVISDIETKTGKKVRTIATSAKKGDHCLSVSDLVNREISSDNAYLLMFGTGWGLSDTIMDSANYVLEPLSYQTGYNHLSVRSAVSIIMDRLYNAFGGVL